MKFHKINPWLLALIVIGLISSHLMAASNCLLSVPKVKASVNLKYVFTKELNSKNKDILKLYDDFSYEFLFFEFYNKKPRVKREKGRYSFKRQKLVLKNKSKSQPKEHSTRFLIKEDRGLFVCNRFGFTAKEEKAVYSNRKDAKYWQATYKDSVFGEITNDYNAITKIVKVKPVYVPLIPIAVEPVAEPVKIVIHESFISIDSLKKIKAIIIVGPVESLTKEFVDEQKRNAKYLKSIGVQVIEFYHPNAKWPDIVKASEGAHIMIYSGHGSASVLCITNEIVYSDRIATELKLHKNALVIFNHACESAGSSATDRTDIGNALALKRVGDYAKPYVALNAGAYFANNYYNCLSSLFDSFFKRIKMKDIYTDEAGNYAKIEIRKKYVDPRFEIGISSNRGNQQTNGYNVAYVGKPNFTVVDFFK